MNQLVEKVIVNHLVEKKVEQASKDGIIKGSVHLSFGQEAVDVGVISAFENLMVYGNHRSHGQYLVTTGDIKGFFRELIKGNGGSQHLYMADKFISNGVLGNIIPVAVGNAMAFKRKGIDRQVICFIGDGALGEGIVYESLMMASIFKLPIIFVVIDNGYSMSRTLTDMRMGGLASCFKISWLRFGCSIAVDVFAVCKGISEYREEFPLIVYAETKRLCGHSISDTQVYRPKEELDEPYVNAHCPVKYLSRILTFSTVYKSIEADVERIFNEVVSG